MSDPTQPNPSDEQRRDPTAPGDRVGPARSEDREDIQKQRRLIAERYILHARPGDVARASRRKTTDASSAASKTVTQPSAPATRAPDRPSRLIAGRYRLGPRIGSGRFGPVYCAEDTSMSELAPNHRVAVQLLWGDLANHDRLVEIFERGFIRLRAWRHENINRVLDFGRDGNTFFWITALLDGAPLYAILEEVAPGTLERQEARAVIGSVGNALQFAHSRKKTHGDINLRTVFVTTDFCVKVLDFAPISIARSAPLRADVLGSGEFTAKRSDDVYGLACLAYELLSGRHPYGGSLPEEAHRCGLKPAPIKGLPRREWKALRDGIALQPAKRTATIEEFLKGLGIDGAELGGSLKPTTGALPRGAAPPRRAARGLRYVTALASLGILAHVGYAVVADRPLVPEFVTARVNWLQNLPFPPSPVPEEAGAGGAEAMDDGRIETGPLGPAPAAEGTPPETVAAEDAPSAFDVETVEPPDASVADADDLNGDGERPLVTEADSPAAEPASIAEARPEDQAAEPQAVTDTAAPTETTFEFAEPVVTVTEDSAVASLTLRRLGSTLGETTVVWWTSGETATADEDYAHFGPLTETLGDGEASRTIQIPLATDTIPEPTERFYVEMSYESPAGERNQTRAQVVILDDDSVPLRRVAPSL